MKNPWYGKAVLPLTVLTTSLVALAGNPKTPKEIVHYFAQDRFSNSGIVTNASGQVSLHENSVSNGKPEELRIDLHRLDANSTYQVMVQAGDDTNLTQVAEFTTDGRGTAHLDFRDKNRDNGNGHGAGNSVPSQLTPLTNLRQLAIQDTNGQSVLTADLTAPDKFVFFLKRDLSTNSLRADLQINSQTHSARLRLNAAGLAAATDYSLALNDVVVTTSTSDARGQLHTGWVFANPADVLGVHSLSLLDPATNAVLSVTLP